MVVKYAEKMQLSYDIIIPTNQVRISKQMCLPCELVEFKGEIKTKEAKKDKKKSSMA